MSLLGEFTKGMDLLEFNRQHNPIATAVCMTDPMRCFFVVWEIGFLYFLEMEGNGESRSVRLSGYAIISGDYCMWGSEAEDLFFLHAETIGIKSEQIKYLG